MSVGRSERWIPAAAVLLLAIVLATGCAASVKKEKKETVRIGVTLYDQYDTFISELMNCFSEQVQEKQNSLGVMISLEVMDAAGSQSTQNDQVKTLIEKGCDVICVNLVDRTEPTTITDMAEKAGVPIIFFNRELVAEDLERWDRLYYVGADAFQSGTMQGELAAAAFQSLKGADKNGDGICQYVVLEGEPGHQDATVRTELSTQALIDQGLELEKLGYAIANWNRAQAQTKFAQTLTQYKDRIELVLANNDDMALGAIDALKAAGISREDWPIIVGIDGTAVGLAAVENKEMYGTIYNDKEGQAEAMMNLASALALGESLDDLKIKDGHYIRLDYKTITAVGEASDSGDFLVTR
ncbi:MAG: galactose ABC transporter substrate-binding protein [Eubacteriales bacterium]|nr:galactose ABC transporter substrate-binding protein [Eubacteriales bacterium]